MDKVIFYFSGMGNSLRAARLIAGELGGVKLISMSHDPEAASAAAAGAEMVGFICPVYEWDVPKAVENFVARLTIDPHAYIFMVATYVAIHGRCFETVDALLRGKASIFTTEGPCAVWPANVLPTSPFRLRGLWCPVRTGRPGKSGKKSRRGNGEAIPVCPRSHGIYIPS